MSIPTMNEPPDPILEELHATRRRLFKEHGGVSGLAAFLRQEEAKTTWPIAEKPVGSMPKEPVIPSVDEHGKCRSDMLCGSFSGCGSQNLIAKMIAP